MKEELQELLDSLDKSLAILDETLSRAEENLKNV